MAITKETMKVIANGIDERDAPDVIPGKTIIRVEVPDELADIFECNIDSIRISRKKEDMEPEEIASEKEDEYESTDVEDLVSEIVFEVAEKAAENFVQLTGESDPECIELILKLLSKKHFASLAYALHTIFLAAGWGDAVWRLNLLHACDAYDEATFDLFYYLFQTEDNSHFVSHPNFF